MQHVIQCIWLLIAQPVFHLAFLFERALYQQQQQQQQKLVRSMLIYVMAKEINILPLLNIEKLALSLLQQLLHLDA